MMGGDDGAAMMGLFPRPLLDLAGDVLRACEAAGLTIATAESCTGGLIAGCLTEHAGASHVVRRGYITYADDAKIELLGVPGELFATVGAVSAEVARAMAEGAVRASGADIAVSCTGIAGPGGATAEKAGRTRPSRLRPARPRDPPPASRLRRHRPDRGQARHDRRRAATYPGCGRGVRSLP